MNFILGAFPAAAQMLYPWQQLNSEQMVERGPQIILSLAATHWEQALSVHTVTHARNEHLTEQRLQMFFILGSSTQ